MRPRDDLVEECSAETPGTFVQRHGPMRRYERTVRTDDDGNLVETVQWQIVIPWFGWIFAVLADRALRRRRPSDPDDGRQPWWAPPQRLDERQTLVLGLLAAASLSATFVNTLFTQTLAFASDEFGVGEGTQGNAAAVVRLGILLALPLTVLADRVGRRRTILVAAWSAPVISSLGAFAPSFPFLVATQTIGRPLGIALDILVAVVAAEEMPRGARAYAVSVLAMASGLGAGVAVAALPLADVSEQGWRLVYLVGLVWLVVALDLVKRLPESHRFSRVEHAPIEVRRARFDRRRLAVLGAVAMLTNVFVASASLFQNRFLKEERGFSATSIAVFTFVTATPAFVGLVIGGRLADRRGRRVVAAVATPIGAIVLALAFASSGPTLWFVTFLGGLISTIAYPAMAVYRRELFPTTRRGAANGVLVALALVSGSIGLVITGTLLDAGWSYARVMLILATGSIAAGTLVALFYPETAGRELEELNAADARLLD
jgi:MFS family permease